MDAITYAHFAAEATSALTPLPSMLGKSTFRSKAPLVFSGQEQSV